MAGFSMNNYLTPEQAAILAGVEDPNDRMSTMGGMQRYANMLPQMNQIKERSNGRVVGLTSPMEGLGQMGSQLAGAYMNKNLMDKYGAIMDKNNDQRIKAAQMLAQAYALRNAGQPGAAAPAVPAADPMSATSPVAQAFPVAPQSNPTFMPLYSYTPHDFDTE